MFVDNAINQIIANSVLEVEKKEKAEHKPSGKLSASSLGEPLQWQILKALSVTERVVDEYLLRKFQRGRDVEKWVLDRLPIEEAQQFVEYRGVVGYMDAMIFTANGFWNKDITNDEKIPLEIKSTSNAKYKWIIGRNTPDHGHVLQACLYGLAKKTENVAITYVASDDYRTHTFVIRVADFKDEIDGIIDRFNEQLMKMQIPVFEPAEKWQADPKYNKFPEFATMTQKELDDYLSVALKSKKL